MSFKESANKYLANIAQKHPKLFIGGWFALMVVCVFGSYKLGWLLLEISPVMQIIFTILGVPVLIGTIILELYILWKVYKGISWLMETSYNGSWKRGPLG